MTKLFSRLSVAAAVVVVGLVASSCKSSTEPGGGGCGNNTTPTQSFSGTQDGKSWASNTTVATFSGGVLAISGGDNCTPNNVLTFALISSGTGTYTIGPNDFSGVNAILGIGAAQWVANAIGGGGSGSVTLTTINSTTAVGTYSFTLVASSGGATGNHTVSGSFNVKF